ncbi:MAG: UbiA family prenyltransferase [Chloroflexi bacterium]|nr:UbiA family prenyltransferase [Chloroflexota bacterium]
MLGKLPLLLENIRFEQSIFTLPFAYLGMVLAARGLPTAEQFLWITVAMFGARSYGMSMNRLVDLELDRRNPRASVRPLPSGRLTLRDTVLFTMATVALLLLAAWQLNPLCLALAPVALAVLSLYSYVKRVSWLTHGVLGLSLGGAPVGGWIGVTGQLAWEPALLGLTVLTWAAGFDIIYACGDTAEDRALGIHTLPADLGIAIALVVSALCHVTTVGLLVALGHVLALSWPYWLGVLVAALLLAYEHSLLRPTDLSRLNVAFFRVNGLISVLVFAGAFLSLYT